MKHIKLAATILYVGDQQQSTAFYERLLRRQADLSVPRMTEFRISGFFKLGLMPNDGIAKIIGKHPPHPATGGGIPRCELYLYVEDIAMEIANALAAGAKPISPVSHRDWGDKVCYFADRDGHIIAFAEQLQRQQ